MFNHKDRLSRINDEQQLGKKLEYIHSVLVKSFPFIDRISVALYDKKTDNVKTYINSGGDETLNFYSTKLEHASSLKEIVDKRQPRVVNNLSVFNKNNKKHTKSISKEGYMSSYTMPIFSNSELFGFVFFNSYEVDVFKENVLAQLDPFGHLIALSVINNIESTQTLLAAVKTAREITHLRDDETGSHLDRMSRYSRLIALKIADKYSLSDERIEKIFEFSPLHDIGKIGIPDNILLKPGKLTDEEYEEMKKHTLLGKEFIDKIIDKLGMSHIEHVEIMVNIAEMHHEAVDGSGYPNGYSKDDIPIEARIVSVADVFDALTSKRPYKEAWSNESAFEAIEKLKGVKLDPDCVDALIENKELIEEIQKQFKESFMD